MAIINCVECGKEISDTAKKCPHCGYSYRSLSKRFELNKKQILKVVGIAIVSVLILLTIQILSRPNLKMDDLDVENDMVSTLFLLGIPNEIEDGEWIYKECGIKFYDIPVERLDFNIPEGRYYLLFDAEYNEEIVSAVSKYCKRSHSVSSFDVYSYEDVEVWVSIYSRSGNIQIHK